jgi:predicted 3-demethylubiquinone-9 3-methyltransferase (glyoxalase superfamily)
MMASDSSNALFQRITPCLWFDSQAEEAARFYVGIFRNSRIVRVTRYGEAGREIHGRPPGSVMTVQFELDGQQFTALNGGPLFTFSEAVSLQVSCATQQEVDHFWSRLCDGGEEGPCGWLKDRYGLSWQVVPKVLEEMLTDGDAASTERVTHAYLQMKKFDIAALHRAFTGNHATTGET